MSQKKKSDKKARKTVGSVDVGGSLAKCLSKVQISYNKFLRSGKLFAFFTWLVQITVQCLVMYMVTLIVTIFPVVDIINEFIAFSEAVDRSEFFWVPVGFICLVMALMLVRAYAMLWNALGTQFGKLREKRYKQLSEKYGD